MPLIKYSLCIRWVHLNSGKYAAIFWPLEYMGKGKKKDTVYRPYYVQLLTGNKNPVHGRKLCTPCTANFQYTKIEKPAPKRVWGAAWNSQRALVTNRFFAFIRIHICQWSTFNCTPDCMARGHVLHFVTHSCGISIATIVNNLRNVRHRFGLARLPRKLWRTLSTMNQNGFLR